MTLERRRSRDGIAFKGVQGCRQKDVKDVKGRRGERSVWAWVEDLSRTCNQSFGGVHTVGAWL
jgi:hypothetical protein